MKGKKENWKKKKQIREMEKERMKK